MRAGTGWCRIIPQQRGVMEPVGPSRVERRLAAIRDRREVPKHLHGLQTESRLSRSLRHEPYFAQLPANAEKPGVGGGLRSPAQRRERAVEVVARCGGGRRGWPPPDLPTCSRHPGFTARATASRDDPKRASVFYETASPARVSPDSLVEESGFEPAVPLCERIGLSGKNADASQTTRMGLERVGHVAGTTGCERGRFGILSTAQAPQTRGAHARWP